MSAIRTLANKLEQKITGQYLLTHIEHVEAPTPHSLITLEDYSGIITLIDSNNILDAVTQGLTSDIVEATFTSHLGPGEVFGQLISVRTLEAKEVISASSLIHHCYRDFLDENTVLSLVIATSWGLSSPFREFLNQVLLDENIRHDFYLSPASPQGYYAYQGGLAKHSVTSMELAEASASAAGMSAFECDATKVIALLQRVGSIGFVNNPDYFYCDSSETIIAQRSYQLLKPHLAKLRVDNEECANLLEYAFQYLSQPAQYRAACSFAGIELAIAASESSIALDKRKQFRIVG